MSKKSIGVSKTRPTSEARPLGTPKSGSKSAQKIDASTKKALDNETSAPVVSETAVIHKSADVLTVAKDTKMELIAKLNDSTRRSTSVVFDLPEGRRGSVRISKSVFNGSIPSTLTVVSDQFAEPRKPVAKMSAEERKLARAAQPKLTLAEKIAKRERSLADLKAKAEKQAQTAAQPSL